MRLPGLREVRAATPEGRCPFCPKPVKLAGPGGHGGRNSITCGSKLCKRQKLRHYWRDWDRDEAKRNAQVAR